MNLKILSSFFISFLATIFVPVFFPKLHLMTFAPFISMLILYCSFKEIAWIAFLATLVADCFSTHHFGLVALSYTLPGVFFYRYRRLFEDKPFAFALLTSLVSFGVSITQVSLFFLLEKGFILSFKWVVFDLFLFSLIDGLYALLCFAWPFVIFEMIHYKIRRWMLLRR